MAQQDRTCWMCNHRLLNWGLLAARFESFNSNEHANDPIEDEHHVIPACFGYVFAGHLFQEEVIHYVQDSFSKSISNIGQS